MIDLRIPSPPWESLPGPDGVNKERAAAIDPLQSTTTDGLQGSEIEKLHFGTAPFQKCFRERVPKEGCTNGYENRADKTHIERGRYRQHTFRVHCR